jgi:hypothetical protein
MTRSTEPIESSQHAASRLIAGVEIFCDIISHLLRLALLIATAAISLQPHSLCNCQLRHHPRQHFRPVTQFSLAKQAHRWIPRRILALY